MTQPSEHWERSVLERLASSALEEQRRARRWGIFFKFLTFAYLFILLFVALGWIGGEIKPSGPYTALVDLTGVIASDSPANAEDVVAGLRDAFESGNAKGVILRINSPGGSPVQAASINSEIRRLRSLHPQVPVYAVVEDICASGGYYVAVAADKIYVDKASMVGSIGVLMDGFGFTEAMKKLGIERRLLTAGENKGFLDPFSPLDPRHRDYARQMLAEIHQQFIGAVKAGRGNRLKEQPELFSGLMWTGERSVELGLADGIGSVEFVAREVLKAEEIVNFTRRENLAERLARRFGTALGESLLRAASPDTVR
ncbi:MAG TPA: S49 family peptidase [Burkholderiales bacterium]|nr:S49 family peptidase [Burkholderiales bacterium]